MDEDLLTALPQWIMLLKQKVNPLLRTFLIIVARVGYGTYSVWI
jgi:hypothetical protein